MRKNERPMSATTNGRHDSPATTNQSASPSLQGAYQSQQRSSASSPLLGTDPLPDDDHSLCPYCHKNYRKPRVLDCLHSICEDCIIAQLDGRFQHKSSVAEDKSRVNMFDCELEEPKVAERPTPPGVIRCPICFQESHVGNDVRYVHSMLLDFVRVAELNENPNAVMDRRCRACKSEQHAVAVCAQCQSDLCSNCLTAHSVMKLFDGHVVTKYEDLDQRGLLPDSRPVLCGVHNQHSKFLCATCESTACKQCLEMEHVNHRVIEVTDLIVNAIKEDILYTVEKVEKKYNNSMRELSSLPDRNAQLLYQYETEKARVEAYFEDIQALLDEAKEKKLRELDEARQIQETNCDEAYRKAHVNEARIHDAITFTRRLLTKGNGMELVTSRRKVMQQLGNLSHAIPSQGQHVELEFQPLPRKQMEAHFNALTGIVVGRVTQPAVKEVAAIGSELADKRVQPPQHPPVLNPQDDWGRSMYTAIPPAPQNLGAIGGERKKNQNSTNNTNGSSRNLVALPESFGWPPSSNPPDSSTPPPVQQSGVANGITGNSAVNQQLSSLPNLSSAAGIRSDLIALATGNVDLSLLANGNSPVTIAGQNQPLFQPAVWSQPGLNNFVNTTTQNPASLAANLPNSILMQQKMAQMLSQFSNARAAPLLTNNMISNRQQQPLDFFMNLNLNSTPHASAQLMGNAQDTVTAQNSQALGSQITQRVSDLKVHSVFGTSQQGSTIRELHCPSGFCLSETDDILIADTNNHRVVVCGPPHPWKIGRPGTDDGQLCFPRKVISLKGDTARYVVLDKGGDGKTRAQIFEARGEFVKRINMVALVPRGGIEVSAATANPNGQLLLVDTAGMVYSIDVDNQRVAHWFDASAQLGEASDVAMFESTIYITDFKHHCVQVFSADGKFIRKMGEPSQTPYPIGIDVSKSGEVLVADTHGNHLHVVVFGPTGDHVHSFTHNEFRLSRCVGLRIAKSGHIVTLCKHNHTLFVFKPLILPNGNPVPTPMMNITSSLLNKF